jgi:hypothetical protein
MSFQLAHPGSFGGSGAGVPRIIEKSLAAAQAFKEGSLILADASDNYAECGADPAAIAAVSVSGCGADASGFNRFAKIEFPPGKMQGIAVNGTVFIAKYIGGLPAANGASYGVVKDADLFWKVDFTDAVNTRLKLLDRRTNSPENIARVVVSFLAANVQII